MRLGFDQKIELWDLFWYILPYIGNAYDIKWIRFPILQNLYMYCMT